MPNQTKDISSEKEKSSPWGVLSDKDKKAKEAILMKKIAKNTNQLNANQKASKKLQEKISATKATMSQALKPLFEKKEELQSLIETMNADAMTETPSPRKAFDSKRPSTSSISGVLFSKAISGLKRDSQTKPNQARAELALLENQIKNIEQNAQQTIEACEKSLKKIKEHNSKIRSDSSSEELIKLNAILTSNQAFKLPRKERNRMMALGNVAVIPLSIWKKIFLMQLDNALNDISPREREQLGSESHLDLSNFNYLLIEQQKVTAAAQDLLRNKEISGKPRSHLSKWSSKEFKEEISTRERKAQERNEKNTALLDAWEESMEDKYYSDLVAFAIPSKKPHIKRNSQTFQLLLKSGGNVFAYYPLLRDVLELVAGVKEYSVSSINQEKVNQFNHRLTALKAKMKAPEKNSIINQLDQYANTLQHKVDAREIFDIQRECQKAFEDVKPPVYLHARKTTLERKKLAEIRRDILYPRAQLFGHSSAIPVKTEVVASEIAVEKRHVRFADEVTIIPATHGVERRKGYGR